MAELATDLLPLKGTLVLDLSRALAGPYGAQVLSDLGAEVIKIEQPDRPDEMRGWPPFDGDLAMYFAVANRNKRCLTLDLSTSRGRDVLLRLVEKADVVVENFRSGVLEKLGIGFDRLRETNPGIVLCSIKGFGRGEYENRPAYDAAMQAFTGIMSVTGDPKGDVQRAGVAVVDFSSGLYAACGILAALARRSTQGRGGHVEVNLVDSGISVMAYHLVTYLMTGRVIQRAGTTHPAMAPCKVYKVSDGHDILIVVANNGQFSGLCGVLGHPEWATDERFATPASRVANRDELDDLLQSEFAKRSGREWMDRLADAGVAFAPVNRVDHLASDPIFTERLLGKVPYKEKDLSLVRSPIQLDGEVLPIRRPPPTHGEHSSEVLEELGFAPEEITELRAAGIV